MERGRLDDAVTMLSHLKNSDELFGAGVKKVMRYKLVCCVCVRTGGCVRLCVRLCVLQLGVHFFFVSGRVHV